LGGRGPISFVIGEETHKLGYFSSHWSKDATAGELLFLLAERRISWGTSLLIGVRRNATEEFFFSLVERRNS